MNTNTQIIDGRRRRRQTYTQQFKDDAVKACQHPGISIASLALANGLNANVLRRWMHEADRQAQSQQTPAQVGLPAALVAGHGSAQQAFVAATIEAKAPTTPEIRIELRRGSTTINLSWPVAASADCAAWLGEWLR